MVISDLQGRRREHNHFDEAAFPENAIDQPDAGRLHQRMD
jgi:hypothetical protein